MPMKSKAQWRFLFATHKPFARKWAHQTPSYKALPRRKGAGTGKTRAMRIKSALMGR
jgi:hypothetical protein